MGSGDMKYSQHEFESMIEKSKVKAPVCEIKRVKGPGALLSGL